MLELITAIVIVGILAVLGLAVAAGMRARAQRVQCTANLKSLHTAAELFLQQNGSWPQIRLSEDDSDSGDQAYARAWISALKPFGPNQKTWICPTIQNLMKNPDLERAENVRLDYVATNFDDKPVTPHRWARQPWFAEIGNLHGNGNLIIFADGSVSDLNTIAAGAKK